MKKLFLSLLCLFPSVIYAAGDQIATTNPRALWKTTGTWTAGQYMSWITVSSCTGCGGGGGGGGGGAIYDGLQTVGISTFAIPGFPVEFDGVGFATIAVINSSPTWTGAHTFNSSSTFIRNITIGSNVVVNVDHKTTDETDSQYHYAILANYGKYPYELRPQIEPQNLSTIQAFMNLKNDPANGPIGTGGGAIRGVSISNRTSQMGGRFEAWAAGPGVPFTWGLSAFAMNCDNDVVHGSTGPCWGVPFLWGQEIDSYNMSTGTLYHYGLIIPNKSYAQGEVEDIALKLDYNISRTSVPWINGLWVDDGAVQNSGVYLGQASTEIGGKSTALTFGGKFNNASTFARVWMSSAGALTVLPYPGQQFISTGPGGVMFTSMTVFSKSIFLSSINVQNVITTTGGIIAPSSTFTWISISGSSIALKNYTLVFPTAPIQGQHLFVSQVNGNNVVVAGGGDDAGSGGTGSADNLGSHLSTMVLTAPFGITSSSGIFISSLNVMDVITSTTGFLVYGGTVTGMLYVDAGRAHDGFPSLMFSNNTGSLGAISGAYGVNIWESGAILAQFAGNPTNKITFNKQVQASGGSTASTPDIILFALGSNSGIYHYNNGTTLDNIGFASGGNEALRVQVANPGAGGVAVGRHSPIAGLTVSSITAGFPLFAVRYGEVKFEVNPDSSVFLHRVYVSSPIYISSNTIIYSSATAMEGFTSTTGFVGGGATFTWLNVGGVNYLSRASTSDAQIEAFKTFESTNDAQHNKFVNFRSTTDAALLSTGTAVYQYAVINATNTNLLSSTQVWTGLNTWTGASTFTYRVTLSSTPIDPPYYVLGISSITKQRAVHLIHIATGSGEADEIFEVYPDSWAAYVPLILASSMSATDSIVSQKGFIAPSSTFGVVNVSTIDFLTPSPDNKQHIQIYPAMHQVFSSTFPNAAISSMTVSFSTASSIYATFYGSANAGTDTGDIYVYFNGNTQGLNKNPLYTYSRSTTTQTNASFSLTSGACLGVMVYGAGIATSTLRMVKIEVEGNEINQPKIFRIWSVSCSTTLGQAGVGATMASSEVRGAWFSNEQITSITVSFAKLNRPWAESSKWRVGAYMEVAGRRYDW